VACAVVVTIAAGFVLVVALALCVFVVAHEVVVVMVVVVILTRFGWCHTSLDGRTSHADLITIVRDLAPPFSHIRSGPTFDEVATLTACLCEGFAIPRPYDPTDLPAGLNLLCYGSLSVQM
jgi:hypothetical protein